MSLLATLLADRCIRSLHLIFSIFHFLFETVSLQDKEAAEALAREAQAASDQHKKVANERLTWFKCITAFQR